MLSLFIIFMQLLLKIRILFYILTQNLFAFIQIAKCKRGLRLVSFIIAKLNIIL
jgi:hypothetical protein